MALRARQQRFVDEYMIDLNATQAAIRAGYSVSTAAEQGHQLLQKTSVATEVARRKAELSRRTGVTAERVLEELSILAFADLGVFVEFGPNGVTIKDTTDLDPRLRRALAEVSEKVTSQGKTTSFKLHDKVSALTKLGQYLGLFVEKHEFSGPGGGPVKLALDLVVPDGNGNG